MVAKRKFHGSGLCVRRVVGGCCRVAPRVATEVQAGLQMYITILTYLQQFRTIPVTAVQKSYWASLNASYLSAASFLQGTCWGVV